MQSSLKVEGLSSYDRQPESLVTMAKRQTLRLLNVDNLEFQDKFEVAKPPVYLTLSHRWGDHEVSFEEIRKLNPDTLKDASETAARSNNCNSGVWKIRFLCLLARASKVD